GTEIRAGIRAAEGMATLDFFWKDAMKVHSAPSVRTKSLFLRRAVQVSLGLRFKKKGFRTEFYINDGEDWRLRHKPAGTSPLHGAVCSVILGSSEDDQRKLINNITSVMECWIWRWQ